MKTLLLLSLLVCSLSARAAAPAPAFYFGEVTYLNEQTKEKGTALSLVKRVVLPEQNRIVETVVEKRDGIATEFDTRLLRIGKTNSFELDLRGFPIKGVMNFVGEEWNWNGWNYDFLAQLPKGTQLIRGQGAIFPNGHIETTKTIEILVQGEDTTRIVRTENLAPVSEAAHTAKRAELLAR